MSPLCKCPRCGAAIFHALLPSGRVEDFDPVPTYRGAHTIRSKIAGMALMKEGGEGLRHELHARTCTGIGRPHLVSVYNPPLPEERA